MIPHEVSFMAQKLLVLSVGALKGRAQSEEAFLSCGRRGPTHD